MISKNLAVKFVPSLFRASRHYSSTTLKAAAQSAAPAASFITVESATTRVMNVVRSIRSCPHSAQPDDIFAVDLGFDSMIRAELNQKIADEFCLNIPAVDSDGFASAATVAKYIAASPKAR